MKTARLQPDLNIKKIKKILGQRACNPTSCLHAPCSCSCCNDAAVPPSQQHTSEPVKQQWSSDAVMQSAFKNNYVVAIML